MKILIVEDDAMNRELLVRWLEREGFHALVAANGALAVALARTEHPDLILMDLGLPVMNGWQATHRIKSMPETRAVPIIALTAYALHEERSKALLAGCDDYETKPIDFTSLRTKIHTLLHIMPSDIN